MTIHKLLLPYDCRTSRVTNDECSERPPVMVTMYRWCILRAHKNSRTVVVIFVNAASLVARFFDRPEQQVGNNILTEDDSN